MPPAPAATDLAALDAAALRRRPVDRLFVVCVLGASLAYLGFVVAMRALPSQPEAERQGYLGVVSGESQPVGLGSEADPAPGTALRSGSRTATYLSHGAPPRPIEGFERESEAAEAAEARPRPSRPHRIPASHFTRAELPATPSGAAPGPALGFAALRALARVPAAARGGSETRAGLGGARARLGPWAPRTPPSRQLSPP